MSIKLIKFAICLVLFLTVSCSRQQSQQQGMIAQDLNYKGLISGVWAQSEEENAFFSIKDDSLYFIEHLDESVPFEVRGDTLKIFYDGIVTSDIILKLNRDSLILKDEEGRVIRLYKR